MRDYTILQNGPSRSFPEGDVFLNGAKDDADIVLALGGSGSSLPDDETKAVVLVELDTECLGVHTDDAKRTLGFARYRNGNDAPTGLVELVRLPGSDQTAIDTATAFFEERGFEVVVCADHAGRIIDRLVRPKYNAALRFLDEGLARAEDMDMTCRMGLGYPDGPIERVVRGGLARHYDVSKAIFEMTAHLSFMPARQAVIARAKEDKS